MFRTLFHKQLALHLGTLIISFIILGAVLSQVIRGFFMDQRLKLLDESVRILAEEVAYTYAYGTMDMVEYYNQAVILEKYLKATYLLLNADMSISAVSANFKLRIGAVVDAKELEPLKAGKSIITRGRLNGVYSEDQLIAGYPVMINGYMAGAVVIISSLAELNKTIWDMYKATGLCLSVAIVIGGMLIYIASGSIAKPLRQMNYTARLISGGDFEKRIDVKGVDEVAQLAQSLNNMADSLNHQEKNRREFIANISHDLRSPLTSMRGFIQAIMDGTVPSDRVNHYLEIVLDESERLSKLADDVVDLSQIQAQKVTLDLTTFDINDLIRTTAMIFERRIREKNQLLTLNFADETDFVKADRDKIARVLYNLLDNAVKFTLENGEMSVDTSVKDRKVWIMVRDTGIGISPEEQKKIFERFFKADASRGMDKRGNGLGLSIVREFVKAHGSSISLESAPGVGTSFTFPLDLASFNP
ncbi:MAG: HAMP domain-containing histidine kinase [Clostridiales bacterium]|jgi:signal transduction histidine kinase|nr:HAMP domain-containing histidine kinase [Clostridiales bacterium]